MYETLGLMTDCNEQAAKSSCYNSLLWVSLCAVFLVSIFRLLRWGKGRSSVTRARPVRSGPEFDPGTERTSDLFGQAQYCLDSFSSNKVMETPGKRGPRLGQIVRESAKRSLLGSQDNTTETDFMLDFSLCVLEARLK